MVSISGSAPALEVSIVMVGALLRPDPRGGDSGLEVASDSAIIVLSSRLAQPGCEAWEGDHAARAPLLCRYRAPWFELRE